MGIPFEFADSYLKSEEIATPACGLVRNDVVIWWLAASTQQNYKLKFETIRRNIMRAVLTRVKSASVTIDGKVNGKIGKGFLILLGVGPNDTEKECRYLAEKALSLRIFEDENGKMNLGLDAVGGEVLVVSQFTLYGNCRKGRRPSFTDAAGPELGNALYEKFLAICEELGYPPQHGEFGADMKVESINDGPVTLILDTDQLMDTPRR